jgi:hypothetical protein
MQVIPKFSWAASGALAILAGLFVLAAIFPSSKDPHGGMYGLVLAAFLLIISAYLFVVGLWFHKKWRGRWLVLGLPPSSFAFVVFLSAVGALPPL